MICVMRLNELDQADVLDDFILGVDADAIPLLRHSRRFLGISILKNLSERHFKNSYCDFANTDSCSGHNLPANPVPGREITDRHLENAR